MVDGPSFPIRPNRSLPFLETCGPLSAASLGVYLVIQLGSNNNIPKVVLRARFRASPFHCCPTQFSFIHSLLYFYFTLYLYHQHVFFTFMTWLVIDLATSSHPPFTTTLGNAPSQVPETTRPNKDQGFQRNALDRIIQIEANLLASIKYGLGRLPSGTGPTLPPDSG